MSSGILGRPKWLGPVNHSSRNFYYGTLPFITCSLSKEKAIGFLTVLDICAWEFHFVCPFLWCLWNACGVTNCFQLRDFVENPKLFHVEITSQANPSFGTVTKTKGIILPRAGQNNIFWVNIFSYQMVPDRLMTKSKRFCKKWLIPRHKWDNRL